MKDRRFNSNQNTNKPKFSMWRLIYPLLIFIGASIIASIVFGFVFAAMSSVDYASADFDVEQASQIASEYAVKYSNYISMVESVIVIALGILFMKRDKKRLFQEGFLTEYDKVPVIFFGIALLLGAAAAATGNNLIGISGLAEYYSETIESLNNAVYSGGIIVEVIAIGILAPVAEEMVFRGLLYKRSREQLKPLTAMILTSFLFAFFHGNVVQGVYAFLIGILCAFALERFKNILAPILVHIGANIFSIVMVETGASDFITQSNTTTIIYIVIMAALVAVFTWLIHDKVEPKILVSAPNGDIQ